MSVVVSVPYCGSKSVLSEGLSRKPLVFFKVTLSLLQVKPGLSLCAPDFFPSPQISSSFSLKDGDEQRKSRDESAAPLDRREGISITAATEEGHSGGDGSQITPPDL